MQFTQTTYTKGAVKCNTNKENCKEDLETDN